MSRPVADMATAAASERWLELYEYTFNTIMWCIIVVTIIVTIIISSSSSSDNNNNNNNNNNDIIV